MAQVLKDAGHDVILLRNAIAPESPDPIVAIVSARNDAILVSFDQDFKAIASRAKVSNHQIKKLSRINCRCVYPQAANRMKAALSFIETEWKISQKAKDKRMFIEIQGAALKTLR